LAAGFFAGAAFFAVEAAFLAGAAFFADVFVAFFAAGAEAWSAGVRRIALRAAVTADEASDFRVLRAISGASSSRTGHLATTSASAEQ
jgi:hypothetical protein